MLAYQNSDALIAMVPEKWQQITMPQRIDKSLLPRAQVAHRRTINETKSPRSGEHPKHASPKEQGRLRAPRKDFALVRHPTGPTSSPAIRATRSAAPGL